MDASIIAAWQRIHLLEYCQHQEADCLVMEMRGPQGHVRAENIGYIEPQYWLDRPDRMAETYATLVTVAQGYYHCCLTGRVFFIDRC